MAFHSEFFTLDSEWLFVISGVRPPSNGTYQIMEKSEEKGTSCEADLI